MDAYELSNEALLKEFMEACARAGVSNSGLCYSPTAGVHQDRANYFRGVVLARLEGEKPPFKPGDTIICVKPNGAYQTTGYCHTPMRGWTEPQKVVRLYYKGAKVWELKVANHNNDEFYRAEDFALAPTGTINAAPSSALDKANKFLDHVVVRVKPLDVVVKEKS